MNPVYAQRYRAIEDRHWWFQGRRAIVQALCVRFVAPRAPVRIFDIGCGIGMMMEALAPLGMCYGMDGDPSMVACARERIGVAHVFEGVAPAALPPVPPCDVALLLDVLEHCDDEHSMLQAIRTKLLVSGGLLMITVPAYSWLWSPHDVANEHKRRYTRRTLIKTLETNGFVVRKCSYFNTILFPAVVIGKLLERIRGSEIKGHLTAPPRLINALLQSVFQAERLALPFLSFPFGGSLVAIAETSARPRA